MPSVKIIGVLVLEKVFKDAYHIWAWRPSWSCDLDSLYIFFHSQRGSIWYLALIGQAVSEKIFANGGHIHVYSPGAGADYPLGSIVFINTFTLAI